MVAVIGMTFDIHPVRRNHQSMNVVTVQGGEIIAYDAIRQMLE